MNDDTLLLALIVPLLLMPIVGLIAVAWYVWDDYRTYHTKHKEKFFGDD